MEGTAITTSEGEFDNGICFFVYRIIPANIHIFFVVSIHSLLTTIHRNFFFT